MPQHPQSILAPASYSRSSNWASDPQLGDSTDQPHEALDKHASNRHVFTDMDAQSNASQIRTGISTPNYIETPNGIEIESRDANHQQALDINIERNEKLIQLDSTAQNQANCRAIDYPSQSHCSNHEPSESYTLDSDEWVIELSTTLIRSNPGHCNCYKNHIQFLQKYGRSIRMSHNEAIKSLLHAKRTIRKLRETITNYIQSEH